MGRNARNTVTTILMILALLAFGGGSANADIMITVSPQCGGVGDTVTISADSTSGGQFFRYFVNTLSHCGTTQRNWQIIKDWSTDKTATWVLGEAGIHTFVVQVADDTTQSCVLEQMGATYDVGGADCFHPTEVMLTPASGVVNEPVTITAVTEGTNLQYRLYVREGDFCDPTQDLTFTLLEDWTNANSFTFTPAAAGVYTLIIWATSDINDSCVGQGGVVYVVAEQPMPDGAVLYADNCARCHQPLANSGVRGASAAQTQAAIDGNLGGMGSLSSLTAEEVQAIADALGQIVARVKSELLNILN